MNREQIQVTYSRGWGQYRKKFRKYYNYNGDGIRQLKADRERYGETGWECYIYHLFPIDWSLAREEEEA